MEPTQKEYLKENLPKILPILKCSTTLLVNLFSKGFLTEEDLEVLDAKRKESATAETAKLFDILYTKTSAFNGLVEALTKAGATGALDMIKGFSENKETEKEELKVSRFSLPPKYLAYYLPPSHNIENTFIIYSDDPALTCERISETVTNSDLLSPETFLMNISYPIHAHGKKDARIGIVNCGNDILSHFQEAKNLDKKFILVAHIGSEKPKHIGSWANEEILWNELTATCRRNIFKKVQEITNISQGSECWETCENLENAALLQLIKGDSPIIFNETIPPSLKYYIPRQLISRCKISNTIFDSVGPDIFLIEEIEPYQLSILVSGKPTESSSSILTNSSPFKTKFIVLQSPAHVKDILSLANNLPVHHLTWYNKELTWKFSKGTLSNIQQHVDDDDYQMLFRDEKDFIAYVNTNDIYTSYVCISDTPGMGKSKLLEKLASLLQEQASEELVSFVVINELVQELKSVLQKQPELRTELASATLQAVSNLICCNDLGKQKIKHNKGHLRHLLLDAFDEINAEDVTLGYDCLQSLPIAFPKTKFWITTRPHLLVQVEERLSILGYNIKPFDKSDQINFLSGFWNKDENLNPKKLKEFGNQCLDSVASKLDCNEDFAGIPLQCLLIGEVYQSEAEFYSNTETVNIASVPVFKISSIVELYDELVRQKFDKFFKVHENSEIDLVKLEQTHMFRSLLLLFPSFAKSFQCLNHGIQDLTICSAGIMEPKPSKYKPEPQFIHRTFAEYFVAKLTNQTILSKDKNFSELLYTYVLETVSVDFYIRKTRFTSRTFKYNVICYFLDAFFTKFPKSEQDSITIAMENIGSKKQNDIYLACAYTNFQNIFRNLSYNQLGVLKNPNKSFLENCAVIASARSVLQIATSVYELYKNERKTNLKRVTIEGYNLLNTSVICGNFSSVQYLTSTESLLERLSDQELKTLLQECVVGTLSESENIIREKMQILKYFGDQKPIIFRNVISTMDEGNPIFVKNIHTKLALEILVCVSNDIVIKFLHKNVKTYNCTDYHYMLECLPTNDCFSLPVVISQVYDDLPLWCRLFKHIKLNIGFLEFLRNSGFRVATGWAGLSTLEMFVRHKQCASVTDWILKESGEDPNNLKLLEIVLKFRNFSYLAHLVQSQRLCFSTKLEWEGLIYKVCNRIQGVAIGSGETRVSKYIIKILEIAASNGASLTVAPSNDTAFSHQPYRYLQIVVRAKPFLFEVCTFLIDNSDHPWMVNDPDYSLVDALVSVTDSHVSVSEALKYILSKQVNKNYTHFQHLLTYIALKFNLAVVKKIHDWYRTSYDNSLENAPSSFNRKFASLSFICSMEELQVTGYIKSSITQRMLDSEKMFREIPSTILQECRKHPNMNFRGKCELIKSVCRVVLLKDSRYKCVYQCNSAGSTEGESSQQFIPIFIDNVLTWVFKNRSSADDEQAILEVAKLLIDCGANVNEEEGGNSPLFNIYKHGLSIEWYILLVRAGGRLFHPTDNKKHLIINLINRQSGTYCQMQSEILKTRAADIIPHFGTLLCNVIWYNCELEFVKELCEWHTKNVEAPLNCVTGYVDGIEVTCLHAALLTGNAEILEYIYVTHGCKNVLNASSKPALVNLYHPTYYVNMRKSKEKFVTLLKRIFPLEGMLNAENDPHMGMIYYIRDKIGEYWIELGGRVDATDEKGNTLLHHILRWYEDKHLGTLSKLVKSGASVNAQNLDLETPLHKLSEYRYYYRPADILKLFFDNDADFTICDLNGNSVLHNYARKVRCGDDFHCVAEWFVKHGLTDLFTIQNKDGKAPLQIRYLTRNEETISLLHSYGITTG